MGFRAEGAQCVDGNVTYVWAGADGAQHMLSLAFQSNPGGYCVHTEWYVPGFEASRRLLDYSWHRNWPRLRALRHLRRG